MEEHDIIWTIAALDGYHLSKGPQVSERCTKWYLHYPDPKKVPFDFGMAPSDDVTLRDLAVSHFPKYTRSYDAIMPIISKLIDTHALRVRFIGLLEEYSSEKFHRRLHPHIIDFEAHYKTTPRHLAEVLLITLDLNESNPNIQQHGWWNRPA